VNIIPLADSNLERAISFITRLNQDLAHNIAYFGDSEREITADVKAIHPPEGYGFIALSDQKQLCGLFGVEIDIELGRCWLLGPIVEHDEWDPIADLLYDAILGSLPWDITNQELFFPDQNTRVRNFALRHGFEFYSAGAVLTLESGQEHYLPESTSQNLLDVHATQFIALHDHVFPSTYYSGKQLLELARDEDKRILVHQVNGGIVGYIFIQVREGARDGYIDFIGVDEGFRRQGIGKNLAASGIRWAFQFPFVEKVSLTVKPENLPAMRMYQSLGFETESVSQGYRKNT
jgi:ribosomal protein S18 acetylase RimI-like enzyme